MTNSTTIFRSDVQAAVLRALVDASGPVTASDLARQLDQPLSTVSREVKRLTAAGMVRAEVRGRRALLSLDDGDPSVRAAREAFRSQDVHVRVASGHRRWWSTVPEIAHEVEAQLAKDDESMALRVLIDGLNRLDDAVRAGRIEECLGEPPSVGDERWDALLAGGVRYAARRAGFVAPPWTRRPPLAAWWWPARERARAAVTIQHTPVELSRLGIWLDERNFSSR